MLPGALTWRVERGHRSLPIGVEAVPLFFVCSLFRQKATCVSVKMVSEVTGK